MWIILLLLATSLGFLSIAYWSKDFSKIEKLTLSFCLGMGEISLFVFLLGLINIPLTNPYLFLSFVGIDVLLLLFIFKTKKNDLIKTKTISFPKINKIEMLLILFIMFLIGWSLTQTTVWPISAWDTLALYDFRGIVIADYHSLAKDFFASQSNLIVYNYVYPFSTSLLHAIIYIGGGTNSQFIYSLFYASIPLLLFACLRRRTSLVISLLIASLLATTPELIFASTVAYPNLLYALYFSFSTIYFWEWINYKKTGYLAVSLIFLSLSSWVRISEPYWLINIFFVVLFLTKKRKLSWLIIYLIVFFSISQIWPWYQKYIFSHTREISFQRPDVFRIDFSKIPEILRFFIRWFIKSWVGYLGITSIIVLFYWRSIKKNGFILVWFSGYLALSLAGTYFLSVSYSWWYKIGGSAERISVFFTPLLLYIVSTFLPESNKEARLFFKEITLYLKIGWKKILLIHFR